jgi:hypothetical protein
MICQWQKTNKPDHPFITCVTDTTTKIPMSFSHSNTSINTNHPLSPTTSKKQVFHQYQSISIATVRKAVLVLDDY